MLAGQCALPVRKGVSVPHSLPACDSVLRLISTSHTHTHTHTHALTHTHTRTHTHTHTHTYIYIHTHCRGWPCRRVCVKSLQNVGEVCAECWLAVPLLVCVPEPQPKYISQTPSKVGTYSLHCSRHSLPHFFRDQFDPRKGLLFAHTYRFIELYLFLEKWRGERGVLVHEEKMKVTGILISLWATAFRKQPS